MARCSYCGYAGTDAVEHQSIHDLLQVELAFGSQIPDVRFYQLWAAVAVKCGWPFSQCSESDSEHWTMWADTCGYSLEVSL